MASPILATPILRGKSAKKFLKDFEDTNRKMETDPVYRKMIMDNLDRCHKLYLKFHKRLIKSASGVKGST